MTYEQVNRRFHIWAAVFFVLAGATLGFGAFGHYFPEVVCLCVTGIAWHIAYEHLRVREMMEGR